MGNKLKSEIRWRWKYGTYIERGGAVSVPVYDLPWVPYEGYMRAQLIECVTGEVGRLLVDFPPESTEDNHLHIHPISDRRITVLRGSGEFVARRPGGLVEQFPLVPGSRVWMPRGVLHTFRASTKGLLVESLHNPWVPLEDPRCLVYPG